MSRQGLPKDATRADYEEAAERATLKAGLRTALAAKAANLALAPDRPDGAERHARIAAHIAASARNDAAHYAAVLAFLDLHPETIDAPQILRKGKRRSNYARLKRREAEGTFGTVRASEYMRWERAETTAEDAA